MKHAAGARTAVAVQRDGDRLVVEVTNECTGATTAGGRGTGLESMRERARALGGTLTAGRSPNGWQVRAELPTVPAGA